MADIVIRAEGLGKKYVIGHEGRSRDGTLRDALSRAGRGLARALRETAAGRPLVAGDTTEEFWALKDVSFEVARGEVLGIIGRNGAGKSTLLKILSRITEPSAGRVEIRGRVASLLEVGTGFHPELSGRENIYLNGAILGMTRAEIRRKFDEIVDFAGVERFIDTPVKRYSSGMYVRLAFAVAAHLEPEILIVDEVLAVGDAEFQKKCLGKMGEVAEGGRTVLFVSHNMAAVQALCRKAMFFKDGRPESIGPAEATIAIYLQQIAGRHVVAGDLSALRRKAGAGALRFKRITFLDKNQRPIEYAAAGEQVDIVLAFDGTRRTRRPARTGITIYDSWDTMLFTCSTEASCKTPLYLQAGDALTCRIPRLPLSQGEYKIRLYLEQDGTVEDWIEDQISLKVAGGSFFGNARDLPGDWSGRTVLVDHNWHFVNG